MILISGGTGTLGRELVQRLVASGRPVRVLTRQLERASALPIQVERALGDLCDPSSLSAALRGCSTVVAAAHGFLGPGHPSPEAVDRDGNRALIAAARAAGVAHFVLLSVHGARPDHPMSLCRAKHQAEEALRDSELPFTIIRATPFLETWLQVMRDMLNRKGRAVVFGAGTNPINFVSVRDVAMLVALAVGGETPAGETFELGGPEDLGLATLAKRVAGASGSSAPLEHIPLAALLFDTIRARPDHLA